MPKFSKCRFCGGTNIKQSTSCIPDYGNVCFTSCQDCGFIVRTTADDSFRSDITASLLGYFGSRSEAKTVGRKLWNEFNDCEELLADDRLYCDFPMNFEKYSKQETD